jgi:hypothetical protein
MKHPALIILILLIVTLMGCGGSSDKDAALQLENQRSREILFKAILKDHVYLTDFMNKAMADSFARRSIVGNRLFVKALCTSDNLDTLLKAEPSFRENMTNRLVKIMAADSFVCDVTCTNLMQNEGLRKYLMERVGRELNKKGTPQGKKN